MAKELKKAKIILDYAQGVHLDENASLEEAMQVISNSLASAEKSSVKVKILFQDDTEAEFVESTDDDDDDDEAVADVVVEDDDDDDDVEAVAEVVVEDDDEAVAEVVVEDDDDDNDKKANSSNERSLFD
jgi:hypothetical protein